MKVFYYDKSFEGLLCAVFDAYTGNIFPDVLLDFKNTKPMLASFEHTVENTEEKHVRVFEALCKKISKYALKRLIAAWMSEEDGCDTYLFEYIRNVFDTRYFSELDYGDKTIMAIQRLSDHVYKESNLMRGFVRFQETKQGIFFAAIEPKHNILPLIQEHFCQRFAKQPWIIYDIGRSYGLYYDLHQVQEVFLDKAGLNGAKLDDSLLAEGELLLQRMWREYCESASIKERSNPSLQRHFMPARYWKCLTEMQW